MPPRDDDGGTTKPPIPELKVPGHWGDLKNRVSGDKEWLKFDPQSAVQLGQAISDLREEFRALRRTTELIQWLPNFAEVAVGLHSGNALASKFAQQGVEMYRILDAHTRVLDDMLDTVVAAGKNMVNAESTNEEELRRQLDTISSTTKSTPMGDYSKRNIPKPTDQLDTDLWGDGKFEKTRNGKDEHGNKRYDDWVPPAKDNPYKVKGDREQPDLKAAGYEKTAINAEPAPGWDALYQNGKYLERYKPWTDVVDAAANWGAIGDTLNTQKTAFGNKVESAVNGQSKWEGAGATAMQAALSAYGRSIEPLAQSAKQTQSILGYVAGFLVDTEYWAPDQPKEELDDSYWLSDRQSLFQETYIRGVDFTADKIPTLSPPTTAFNGVEPVQFDPKDTNRDGKVDKGDFDPRDKNQDGKVDEKDFDPKDLNRDGKVDENEQKLGGPGPGPGIGPGPGPAKLKAGPGPGPGLTAEQKKAQAKATERAEEEQKKAAEFAEQQRRDAARRAKEQEAYEKTQRAENDRRQAEAEQRAKDAAARQEADQQQQRAQAAAREGASAAQQAAQQGLQAAQQAVQEALQGGQKGASEALAAAQQAAQNALTNGMPKVGDLASKLGGPGPGPGSLAKGLGLTEAAKLFPRAGAATTVTSAGTGLGGIGRAGAAAQATPGSPGPAGAAGQGAGQGQQNYKRPAYLESDQHLDELLGEAPKVVRPVVEQ
ncbi:hypothetical protein [Nocardia xishanensis]|uniref:hypothetical protein n=1 Tax=Nocardia xishanensis TaxID=238964 RepID=UPI00082DF85A|nr:hypothetical protein [Nocardia xishanensis]